VEFPRRDRRTRDRDVPLHCVRRSDASYAVSQRCGCERHRLAGEAEGGDVRQREMGPQMLEEVRR
jgi:hypothetical protein